MNWIDLDLDGYAAKAMAGVEYTLKFDNGTVRKGTLDGNGYAKEVGVPWEGAQVIYHNAAATRDPKPQSHNAVMGFDGDSIQALETTKAKPSKEIPQ